MFPNYIDRFSRQKKRNNTTKNKQRKNKKKLNKKKKKEIIVPTMNHYPRNGQEGDLEFSTILIPVYKIYLYATLPPSGLSRI